MADPPGWTRMPLAKGSLRDTPTLIAIFPIQPILTGCLFLSGATVVSTLRTASVLLIFVSLVVVVTAHDFLLLWGPVTTGFFSPVVPLSRVHHHLNYGPSKPRLKQRWGIICAGCHRASKRSMGSWMYIRMKLFGMGPTCLRFIRDGRSCLTRSFGSMLSGWSILLGYTLMSSPSSTSWKSILSPTTH